MGHTTGPGERERLILNLSRQLAAGGPLATAAMIRLGKLRDAMGPTTGQRGLAAHIIGLHI